MKRSVLLVDDIPVLTEYLGLLFESEGFEVYSALSAEEALEHLKRGLKIDLIVSDLEMSGESGEWLRVQVRRYFPHVHFILVSGKPSLIPGIYRKPITDELFREMLTEINQVLV